MPEFRQPGAGGKIDSFLPAGLVGGPPRHIKPRDIQAAGLETGFADGKHAVQVVGVPVKSFGLFYKPARYSTSEKQYIKHLLRAYAICFIKVFQKDRKAATHVDLPPRRSDL